jgi:ELWxxDGT repeat protein
MKRFVLTYIVACGLFIGNLAAQTDPYINEYLPASFGLFVAIGTPELGVEAYKVDPATGSATLLQDIKSGSASGFPRPLLAYNSLVLFSACTVNEGCELWKTDGTPAGTSLLADITPGPANTSFGDRIVYAGKAYLAVVNEATLSCELWVTDGTPAGTALVFKSPASALINIAEYKGSLYFGAGSTLYVMQSTGAYSEFRTFESSSVVSNLMAAGGLLFFSVDQRSITELWASDGTAARTVRLRAFAQVQFRQSILPLGEVQGKLVFLPPQFRADGDLWVSDGTVAGTRRITEIAPGLTDGYAGYWASTGTLGFFSATHPAFGTELWATDTTTLGTRLVVDLVPGAGSTDPTYLTAFKGGVLFAPNYSDNPALPGEVWFSDGTAPGTYRVREVLPDGSGVNLLVDFQHSGSIVYFLAKRTQIWRTDATATGTVPVFDVSSVASARR